MKKLIIFILSVILASCFVFAFDLPQNVTWEQKLDVCSILNVSVPHCVIAWEMYEQGNWSEVVYVNQTVYVNVTVNESINETYPDELSKIKAYKEAGLVPVWENGNLIGFDNPTEDEISEEGEVGLTKEEVLLLIASSQPSSDDSSSSNGNSSDILFILGLFAIIGLVGVVIFLKKSRFLKPPQAPSPPEHNVPQQTPAYAQVVKGAVQNPSYSPSKVPDPPMFGEEKEEPNVQGT